VDVLDWFEQLMVGLPEPLGLVVTAVLPFVAIGAGIGAFTTARRARRLLALILGVVAATALIGTLLWTGVMLRA
jgi:hypothetical protein